MGPERARTGRRVRGAGDGQGTAGAGLDPDELGDRDESHLFQAARNGSEECARLLLEYGADPNLEDDAGNTPLAASLDAPEVARVLLEHGANPNHVNERGTTMISEDLVLDDWPNEVRGLVEERREVMPVTRSDPEVVGLEAGHERVPVGTFDDSEAAREWIREELVPYAGQADTVQGELFRAAEALRSEAHRNGNANWWEGHERLVGFLEEHLCDEDLFDEAAVERTRSDLEALRGGHLNANSNDAIYPRLKERVVEFCERNPELIEKPHDEDLGV